MKKLLSLLLTGTLMFGLAGCSSDDTTTTTTGEDVFNVGLIQLVEHTSLDEIREAIMAEIDAQGYGDKIVVDYQNGQNDTSTINTINQKFVADDVDAIVAIATTAAQSAAAATQEIPIIFSAVTDPVAAELLADLDAPNSNSTGVSDAIAVELIFELADELTPGIETYGFVYNMAEVNSVSVIADASEYLDSVGIAYTEAIVTNIGEVTTAVQSLVGKVDALFLPIDNTVASAMANVAQIAIDNGIPVYVAADSMVADGGLATVGVNYTQLGTQTADMLIDILEGQAVADTPVQTLTDCAVVVNEDTAAALGIDVSAYAE